MRSATTTLAAATQYNWSEKAVDSNSAEGAASAVATGTTGAWLEVWHLAQAHLPRMWRFTVNSPGVQLDFSLTSLPMRVKVQRQLVRDHGCEQPPGY